MRKLFFILILILASETSYSQVCCGGGVYDLAVLSLNKRALFNVGYKFDNYMGVWDADNQWRDISQTNYQMTPSLSAAYRFNKHLQAGLLVPYIFNVNELPGLPTDGSGIGDVVLSGRYEIFHEYALYKEKGKIKTDKVTPYFAVTFGMTLPSGKSDENANSEIDITGKGFYTSSLGLSFIKTIIQDKFQLGTDLSWQHSFPKSYTKYYNQDIQPYERKQGDRFNFAISGNYFINFYNSVSLAVSGFLQNGYSINDVKVENTNESIVNFVLSYTYYPKTYFRITPLFKWNIPSNGFGSNTTGSLLFGLSLVYYIENLDDF